MRDSDHPTRPLISVSLRPATDDDREIFERTLSSVVQRNPSLFFSIVDGRTVLSGSSESQLESVCDQISAELQSELLIDEPKVIYLETIRRVSEAEGKYIRQVGGHGNYGHVKLRLEPGLQGSGYQFLNETEESLIPQKFIEAVNLGIVGAAIHGILAGCEIVDFRAVLYDGSCHTEDSNEMAFRFAGSIAFKEAARKALPIVLEPVMSVDVVAPEEHSGSLIRKMKDRRGRIESIEHRDASVAIQAIVPLVELLRSSARGRPAYPMRFAGYEPAPRGGWSGSDGAGVTANKPDGPRGRSGSTSAKPDV